jgi:hypothetical protein
MNLNLVVDLDDLAEAIVSEADYEEIVNLVLSIDSLEMDSSFTDMLYDAVESRMVAMHGE